MRHYLSVYIKINSQLRKPDSKKNTHECWIKCAKLITPKLLDNPRFMLISQGKVHRNNEGGLKNQPKTQQLWIDWFCFNLWDFIASNNEWRLQKSAVFMTNEMEYLRGETVLILKTSLELLESLWRGWEYRNPKVRITLQSFRGEKWLVLLSGAMLRP